MCFEVSVFRALKYGCCRSHPFSDLPAHKAIHSLMLKRFLAFFLLLAPFSLSHAQDSAQRAEIERFRDSVQAVTDSGSLIELEKQLIEVARKDRDNAVLHLRLGFLALRMAELGSTSRYEDAGSEFEWAAELKPDWPYPWLGLGRTEEGTADTTYGLKARFQAMFGTDPMTLAAKSLRRSTTVDPAFVPGLTALVSVVSRQRLNADPEDALVIVRRAAKTEAGQVPEFILARANLERDLGYADSAAAAYRRYLERGGNQIIGRFELMRTLLSMGQLNAQREYYALARLDDSMVVNGLRRDFSLIAGDSGVARFDSVGLAGREAFLRRFWTRRDRTDMRRDGERLAEHYRRLFYAQRHFRRVGGKRRSTVHQAEATAAFEDYRPRQLEFDARGEIYIRHGEPTERVDYPNFCNVSWKYARADGDLNFHFAVVGSEAGQEYRLEASVLGVCSPEQLWISSVFKWGPQYARLVNAGPNSMLRLTKEQEGDGLDDIEEGTTTDRHELTFARRLPAAAQVLAVGRGEGGSQVHFTFAIPGSSLRPEPLNRGVGYTIRTRILVTTMEGEVITAVDTSRLYVTQAPIPAGQFLAGRETLTIPPGTRIFRLALQQGDSVGGVFPTGSIIVGRFGFGSDSLAISDLVLGSRSSSLTWMPTAEDTVFFNPLRTFKEGSSLELYYELYGLRPTTTYTTQLVVRREARGRPELTLSFSEPAGADVTRSRRTVALERLRAGEYTMEIEVRAADGRTVRQTRGFRVVKN
jgi:tetratricopeptide (TPR) repeat protein